MGGFGGGFRWGFGWRNLNSLFLYKIMQTVLFFSAGTPPYLPEIDKNYTLKAYTGTVNFERLSGIWQNENPLAILSWQIDGETSQTLSKIFNVRKRWVHIVGNDIPKQFDVVPVVMSAVLGHHYDKDHPLMSVFSSAYKSGSKILRPLRSLQAQTFTNWEWIIWDDSEGDGDANYKELIEMSRRDLRIRVYKAPRHSGYIGEMKRLAASVAYGKFLIEVDHDDDFHPRLLEWIKEASDAYQDAGFFYTDCAELTEETYEPATYGDFFGFGYSGHSFVWSDFHKRHIAQANVAQPNPVTLRHLVGMPNHVRVWRTEVYDRVGKHNPQLAVADDYDLMARTWAAGVKWCHIRMCGYYQYRNRDGNFTFIRNGLIQHNNNHIYQRYAREGKLPECPSTTNLQPQWKTDDLMFPNAHFEYVPREGQWDVTEVVMGESGIEGLQSVCERLEKTELNWRVFVFGKPNLDQLPKKWWERIMWWNLSSETNEVERRRYFNKYINTGKMVVVWPTRS